MRLPTVDWFKAAMALIIIAVLALLGALLLSGCKTHATAPSTTFTPAAPIASASGTATSVGIDVADAAAAVKRFAAGLLESVKGWLPSDAQGRAVADTVKTTAGSLQRTGEVLAVKDQAFVKMQTDLAAAQKGIVDCDQKWRAVYDTEYAKRVAAEQSETKDAQHALGWMSVAGVALLAIGIGAACAIPAAGSLIGKGICSAAVALSLGSVCLLAFFRLTDAMLPILWWTMASVAVLGVAALAWYLWTHRNSLEQVVKSVDAYRATATPDVSAAFKTIANQIQSKATEAMVTQYRTPTSPAQDTTTPLTYAPGAKP